MAPPKGWIPPHAWKVDPAWLLNEALMKSSVQIGREVGIDPSTVRRNLRRLGWNGRENLSRFNQDVRRSPDTQFGGPRQPATWRGGGKSPGPDAKSRRRGPDHPRWKGGPKTRPGYRTSDYRDWRKAVFERDDYTCQNCGERGGVLHAHHLKNWRDHPECRYDVANGQTLCAPCHRQTPDYGGRVFSGSRTGGAWVQKV